jgi:transcriptional regulator with XRE-family HTH domain
MQRMDLIRKRLGWSQQRLADELTKHGATMKRDTVANMLAGRRDSVSLTEAVAFCKAVGVDLSSLVWPATISVTQDLTINLHGNDGEDVAY